MDLRDGIGVAQVGPWKGGAVSRSIIFLYILLVLVIAGTARSESILPTQLPINELIYDEKSQLLFVAGDLNGFCASDIRPDLLPRDDLTGLMKELIILADSGEINGECPIDGPQNYEIAFDVHGFVAEYKEPIDALVARINTKIVQFSVIELSPTFVGQVVKNSLPRVDFESDDQTQQQNVEGSLQN